MKWDRDEIVEKNSKRKDKIRKTNDKIRIESCKYCFDESSTFLVYQTENLYLSVPQKTQMLGEAHLTILPKFHFNSFVSMDEEIIEEIRVI